MPVDASIYSGLQAVDLAGAYGQGLKLRDMMDERKLKQADLAKKKQIDDIYKGAVVTNADGSKSYDQTKLSALAEIDPKAFRGEQKESMEMDGLSLKQKRDQLDFQGQLITSVKDQPSYERAIGIAKQAGMDVSHFGAQYDPSLIKGLAMQTMSAKEQLDNQFRESQAKEQKSQADRQFAAGRQDKASDRQHALDLAQANAGVTRENMAIQHGNNKEILGIRGQQQSERQRQLDAIATAKRGAKSAEMTVAEAKQKGLYDLGQKAEQQYAKAVENPDDYDPTQVGQIIDNSEWAPNWAKNDKAIEAQAAQANWVEAFLRDASGAAIPPNERGAYARDFFPQPGDTQQVVANKAALRKQKMDNARVASGLQPLADDGAMTAGAGQAPQGGPAAKHPQANQAVQWAMANPGDPRSAAILERSGIKPGTAIGAK